MRILVAAISASLIASNVAIAAEADPQTPKEAIEQAEAAQSSSHGWMWYAAGAVVAAVAIGMKSKHGGSSSAQAQSGNCASAGTAVGRGGLVDPAGGSVNPNQVDNSGCPGP